MKGRMSRGWTALAVGMALTGQHAAMGRTLIVDQKKANGAQDGSKAHPFATIQQAADVAMPGDAVLVHAGTYRETVTPKNSGTASARITYQPFGNEVVTIDGADPVTGWQAGDRGVFHAPLAGDFFASAMNQADQVFVDGRMVFQARWPNMREMDVGRPAKSTITKFLSKTRDKATNWTTAVFEDDNLQPQTDGYYVGAEVVIQPNSNAWSWTLSGTVVDQKGKQLTIRSRSDSGKDGDQSVYAVGSRYYLHNLPKMLDADGEWYHDRAAGTLFLRTPMGDSPAKHLVEAKRRDYAFNLDGKSYLTLKGFHLFACTVTTDTAAGDGVPYDANGGDRYPWRGKGTVASANHIVLDGLDGRYLNHFTDMSGHFYLQWGENTGIVLSGSDNVLQNSHLQYAAGNGVSVLGYRNKVLNNLIEDVSYNQMDNAGISTGGAADTFDHEIAFNTIRRCGRSGLTPRNLKNSDPHHLVARIHHNDVSQCMLQDFDGGCLYTGGDGGWTRIDHNRMHDVPGFSDGGVYIDFGKDYIIDHNVIWGLEWGIHTQANDGGRPDAPQNMLIYNNTVNVANLTDAKYGPFGIVTNSGNGANGTVISNNILNYPMNSEDKATITPDNLLWDRTPGSATDPRYADAAHGDFRLGLGSPARDSGVVVPSYTRDGVTIPAFNEAAVGASPDRGAYEAGAPLWRAGYTPPKAGKG